MSKFYKPLIFIGGLLYPIYALPWIIKSMLKNEWMGYFLFAFMMAVMAYTYVPYDTYDLVRHYKSFNDLLYLNFDDIFVYGQPTKRFFYIYLWIIGHMGLPKEFSIAFVAFLVYFFYFLSFRQIIQNNIQFSSEKLIALSLVMILMQIRFLDGIDGMRNPLAFAMFLYGSLKYIFYDKKIQFYIISFLSILIHISVLPLFTIVLFCQYVNLRFVGKTFFIISIIILITGSAQYLFFYLIDMLKPYLESYGLYFSSYMDPNGFWGANYYSTRNFKTLLLEKVFLPLPFYILGFYLFYKNINISNKKIQNLLYLLFTFVVLVSISRTMFNRYSSFFVIFFIYIIIAEFSYEPLTKFKKYFIIFFIASLVLITIADEVKSRDVIFKSWTKLLYTPTTFIFLQHVNENDYIHRESL